MEMNLKNLTMKLVLLAVLICAAAITAFTMSGCSKADEDLLGARFEVPTTNKSLQFPKDFIPLVDSELVAAKAYVHQQLGDAMGMALQQIYREDSSQSAIWIYSISDLSLSKDTTAFLNFYGQGLMEAFGKPNVTTKNIDSDSLLIRAYIVKDNERSYMKTHLICFSKTNNAIVVEYNTPLASYDKYKKSFESSIASIKASN
jgi:hypothetical protein